MQTEFITAQMSTKSLGLLREIAKMTGEKQYRVLERLLAKEKHRITRSGDEPGDNEH